MFDQCTRESTALFCMVAMAVHPWAATGAAVGCCFLLFAPMATAGWQRLKLILEVIEVRLRFIAILAATGLTIGYWDTIKNYWDKYTRPAAVASQRLPADQEFYCPMHPQVMRSIELLGKHVIPELDRG